MAGGSQSHPRPTHDPLTKRPLSEDLQAALRTYYAILKQEADLAEAYDRLTALKSALTPEGKQVFIRITKE